MTILTEGDLRFEFTDDWVVAKFDGTPESNCLKNIPSTKIIDILGVYLERSLMLLEIKDPRGFEVGYLADLQDPANVLESPEARAVAAKFRDALSGIVLSGRQAAPSIDWTPFLTAAGDTNAQIVCVIWLEEANVPLPQWKAHRDFFFKRLKQYMAKLPVQLLRVNLLDYRNCIAGLAVQ